jgi:glycosyltransferase involved in cell wall biosynthesis
LKIAIDALGIHYYGGGRTATLRLLEALFALDQHNEYVVGVTQFEPSLQTSGGNVCQWVAPSRNRFIVRLWAQMTFPVMFRKFDLIHFTKNLGVVGAPTKTVVTVYDLTTLILPDLFPVMDIYYWRHIQKYTLTTADGIIAISNNTAQDICRFYPIDPKKIRVIYPAHAGHFHPPSPEDVARVRLKYALPDEFILHVGRIDRKKNIPLLLEAFAVFQQKNTFMGKLVFVGEEYRKARDPTIATSVERLGLENEVLFTGPLPDDDLSAIFGAAQVSVLCSRHEGFGIVALEAMACGSPLIVTPAGGVVEAVGDAAVVLKGESPHELAEALETVVRDPGLRLSLREKGLHRTGLFNWNLSARQTLQFYQELVQG